MPKYVIFIASAILVIAAAIALDWQAENNAKKIISNYLHYRAATPLRISSVWFDTERLLMDQTIRTYQVTYLNAQGMPCQTRCTVRLYSREIDWQDPP